MDLIKIIDSEVTFHYEQIKRHQKRINQLLLIKQDLTDHSINFQGVPRGTPKKIDYTDAEKLIQYFSTLRIKNKLTDRPLKCTHGRKIMVHKRISESSPIEAQEVIQTRFVKWLNTDYEQYLKIETIFRPSKYFKYLDEVGEIKKQKENKNWDRINIESTGDF